MTAAREKDGDKADGPTLETYVETRFNLLVAFINEKFAAQDVAMRAAMEAAKHKSEALEETLRALNVAADIRYQQRFEAQSDALSAAFLAQQTAMKTALDAAEKAVQAALAAQERAVLKAELASDKRFESVNEFRQQLNDQQQTFIPRAETAVLVGGLNDRLGAIKEELDRLLAERVGVKGGYGYAVGIVGFILTLLSLGVLVMRVFQP